MHIEKYQSNNKMPKHIALIIDGNGRWAKHRGLPRIVGHKFGFDNLKSQIDFVQELGIKNLSVYCFSTENWNRPKKEVDYLMKLFNQMLDEYKQKYLTKDVRIIISGDLTDTRLPKQVRVKAQELIEATKNNTGFILNCCINYGGKQEIIKAVNEIVKLNKTVNADEFEQHLYTKDLLPLDLIIRTSGELRSSNFMPWQSTYSEWYYSKKHWPSFTKKELLKALDSYMKRNRRFGAIKENT